MGRDRAVARPRPATAIRSRGPGWGAVALAGLALAGPAVAVELPLTDDATVTFAAPTRNLGRLPTLVVQGPPGRGSAVLLRFDLSTLPAGTTGGHVVKATCASGCPA